MTQYCTNDGDLLILSMRLRNGFANCLWFNSEVI